MNDSKWTWRAVGLVSILATLLLITGFVYAVSDIINPKGEHSCHPSAGNSCTDSRGNG